MDGSDAEPPQVGNLTLPYRIRMKGLLKSVPLLGERKPLCSEPGEDPGSMNWMAATLLQKTEEKKKELYIGQELLHVEVRDLQLLPGLMTLIPPQL